jgi:hypothetical protein
VSGFFNRVEVERLPNLTIVHLIHDMEVECCVCDRPTFSKLCVPYYCGPVRQGCSEGGYSHACERCYARWERWNDAGMARFRKPAHGGYPTVASSVKVEGDGHA